MQLLLLTLNLNLFLMNALLFVAVYSYYKDKRNKFNKDFEAVIDLVKPRIAKGAVALEEYCFVCGGNAQQPAPLRHKKISVHKCCKGYVDNGDIIVKEVSSTIDNKNINVKIEMQRYINETDIKKIGFHRYNDVKKRI